MAFGDVLLSPDSVSLLVIANILPYAVTGILYTHAANSYYSFRLFGAFGQDYTNYYLSRSIDWPDWIVFAIGPLGVVWILSATIRALGPPFLKNAIGKGSEDPSLIEKDLMSSTSAEVCELWNGHNVVRLAAKGEIQEFLRVTVGLEPKFRVGSVGREEFFLGMYPPARDVRRTKRLKSSIKILMTVQRLKLKSNLRSHLTYY
jgi:hypothetical protein